MVYLEIVLGEERGGGEALVVRDAWERVWEWVMSRLKDGGGGVASTHTQLDSLSA